jgi:SAM-dependent methyltransferase
MTEWSGNPYERYIGRWSRLVAPEFLEWLGMSDGLRWLDVGCGTGALTTAILQHHDPAGVRGCDPSAAMLPSASADGRASFQVADAQDLPFDDDEFDVVVSGLVLNFIPDVSRAMSEMARVGRPASTIAAYVWDYAGEMQFLRRFWDAAASIDAAAVELDEGRRFPVCSLQRLKALFEEVPLANVRVQAIDIPTTFSDFDDLWQPFLGGAGPAGAYAVSLDADKQAELREALRKTVPIADDGSISLIGRALAVRGTTSQA